MDMRRKRPVIPKEWTAAVAFDPWEFRLRLARAKKVRRRYQFERLAAGKTEASYLVRGGDEPYHVAIDLCGKSGHHCTCPDGARKVEIASGGGSLCKHVIAILLGPRKAHLLTSHLLLLAQAGPLSLNICRGSLSAILDLDRLLREKPWTSMKPSLSLKNP